MTIRGKSTYLAAFALILLAVLAAERVAFASDNHPPADSILVGKFTTGGCIHVCESLAMCREAHINEKSGDCRLDFDRQHSGYQALMEMCPGSANRTFKADMVNDSWKISCSNK